MTITKEIKATVIGLFRQGNSDWDISNLVGLPLEDVLRILQPVKDEVKKNEIIYKHPLNYN